MAKILGLDLGTNSIGWAVVDDEKNKIIDTGVRIFPEGIVRDKGKEKESKNAERSRDRQTRRQYYRKRLRKIKLLETLIQFEMCPLKIEELKIWSKWDKEKGKEGREFPSSDEFKMWLKQNPYELRKKALNNNLTLYEFGRILYHLIQRRGFLSNRKSNDEGKIYTGKDNMTGIDDTKSQIKDSTLGNFLYSIYPKENEPYKKITDKNGNELRIRARYTLRDMYIDEFHKIWEKQARQLGLDEKKYEKKKIRFIKGNIDNNRNKKKIENLIDKYGKENVIIEDKKITTIENIHLKKFLAGDIEYKNGELKYKSNESVLFWQRPLRSQKGLLAKCSLEGRKFFDKENKKWIEIGPTPAPLSHPDYEEFRAYQFINNIEYGIKQQLHESQKQQILELINSKDSNFKFNEIPKKLKLEYEKFNYEAKHSVPGNYTTKHLKPLFEKKIWEKHKKDIWHCFYFFEDNDKLIDKLKDKFGFDEEKYKDKILGKIGKDGKRGKGIKLKDGYSNISLKAIDNILPYLRKEYKFSDAVILGGVRNSFRKTVEKKQVDRWEYFKDFHKQIEDDVIKILKDKTNKEGEAIEKIKSYLSNPNNNYGFEKNDKSFSKLYHHSQQIEKKQLKNKIDTVENLRNPIVQQGLNELKRLVNILNEKHKKFDKINVELGRDLKNSKVKREEIGYRISKNEKKNNDARALLTDYGLQHSRENIQKVLFYNEIQEKANIVRCPYTNIVINIADLLNPENKIQIEHIIPRSISLDDSFANKTLCEAKFNGLKGNKTPYEFYKLNNDKNLWQANSWEDVEQRAFKLLPYNKAKRFCSKTEFKADSFIERQLNDTRYISKKSAEILSQICEDVMVMPGSLTAELRHLWGLNNILQPAFKVEIPDLELKINKVIPYYIVLDEQNKLIKSQHIYNKKPILENNETTISGKIDNSKFKSTERFVKFETKATDIENGEYWAKIKLSAPKEIIRIFKDKPETTENEIVLRGKIENKKFKNDGISAVSTLISENGSYWAKFLIINKKFEEPQKDKQPKKTGKQILLFGNVKEGVFSSYIYQCETNLTNGKYWAILDLDFENVEFDKTMNDKPNIKNNQILIQGVTNDENIFVSDIDKEHSFNMQKSAGKYWVVFDITSEIKEFIKIKNDAPELEEKQTLIEGNIWVDKYTGEIKFDPKKNREDHRHHAIDALAIALTKQKYFQKLSTRNANLDEKKRYNKFEKEQLNFPEPWNNFYKDAKIAADKMIISHKQNKKVLTEVVKKINKNGKTHTSKGMAVRGRLHKEFVYGKHPKPIIKDGKFVFEGKKIELETDKNGDIKYYYHIRKSVKDLKTETQLNKIVDINVRSIIINAKKEETKINKEIEEIEKQLKKSQTKLEETTLQLKIKELKLSINNLYTLNNKNGEPVPIKKVRIREEIRNAEKLKDINQWVNPRNNHHIAIYENENGVLFEKVVTLWEAVERKKQGLPVIDKNPTDGSKFVQSLGKNEMFILGLSNEEFEDNKNNNKFLSKCLFKVQKIAGGDYFLEICFRHHLDSRKAKYAEKDYRYIKGFGTGKTGWQTFNPIKVKISPTGKITKIKKQ